MKIFKNFFLFIVLFLMWNVWSLEQIYFPKWPSYKNPLSIQLQSEYFNTVANYKLLGEYEDLPDQNFLTYVANNLSVQYFLTHWFHFETFLNTMWAASQTDQQLRNKFGLTYTGLGLTFLFKIRHFQINAGFKGGLPITKILQDTDEIVFSDGAYFLNPHLWLMYQHPSTLWQVFYNINFLYRTKGLSSLVFNKLGAVILTQMADAGFSVQVFLPVLRDTYYKEPNQRWDITKKVNGDSYKFYSIDPGVLSFTGWMEWKFHPIYVNIYANIDTYGQRYAKGITLGVITRFQWNTKSKDTAYKNDFFKQRTGQKSKSYFLEQEDETSTEINQELMDELDHLR